MIHYYKMINEPRPICTYYETYMYAYRPQSNHFWYSCINPVNLVYDIPMLCCKTKKEKISLFYRDEWDIH